MFSKTKSVTLWRVTFEGIDQFGQVRVMTRDYAVKTAEHAQERAEKMALRVIKVELVGRDRQYGSKG